MPAVPAPLPVDEASRLAALRELDLLDSLPEAVYDDVVMLASQICGTPIGLISLVDSERQWFKARLGLPDATETHRDLAFCAHAIVSNEPVFVVGDAALDPRFRDNALVTGAPNIRFYAGAPIVMPGGQSLGTVCVLDTVPRQLSAAQLGALNALARQTCALFELRLRGRELERRQAELEALSARAAEERQQNADLLELVLRGGDFGLWDLDVPSGRYTVNERELQLLGLQRSAADAPPIDWRALVHPDDWDTLNAAMAPHLAGKVDHYACEHRMRRADGSWIWVHGHAVVVLRDAARRPLRIVGTHADITERRRVREKLERTGDLLQRMGTLAGVGGWELDLETQQLDWSDEVYRIHELEPGSPRALDTALDFYAPEARPTLAAAVGAAIEHGTAWDLELPLITAKGRRVTVRAQGEALMRDGKAVRLFGAFQDISERKRIEQALIDGERRLRLLTDHLPAVVCHVDADERYLFINQQVERAFGTAPGGVLGRTMREVRGPIVYALLEPHVKAVLRGETVQFEYSVESGGRPMHCRSDYVPDVSPDGSVRGFYASTIDITTLKTTQARLEELALVDPLTGLPNRRQFEQRIAEAMARTRRTERAMAVMFLDIDHFKTINDSLGHAGGDAVLCEFARRLKACVRVTDTVARLAGDEFVLLLEGIDDDISLDWLAHKVVACIRPSFRIGQAQLRVTTSVGVARYDGASQSAFDVLSMADGALYCAKQQGRDRFALATVN